MLPQMFNAVYSSDAFFINLAVVMLRLSAPVIFPGSDHIPRIQPTYCLATVGDRKEARARKVHMIGWLNLSLLVYFCLASYRNVTTLHSGLCHRKSICHLSSVCHV